MADSVRHGERRWMRIVGAFAALSVALVGCTATGSAVSGRAVGEGSGADRQPRQAPADHPLRVRVQPAPGELISPGTPFTVQVTGGRLTGVLLEDEHGVRQLGALSPDQRRWTSRGVLPRGEQLTYRVTARDVAGRHHTRAGTLRTLQPDVELTTAISPLAGQTVGVGMPIVVRFNADITRRAAVEQRLQLHASRPVVGAWSWTGDREVHWRPKQWWPARTDVRLDVNLAGVHASPGVWGVDNRSIPFQVGASMVNVVDVDAHRMTVYRDGQQIRTVPVTTGKGGFLTRGGTKVILEKFENKVMDAATIGIGADDPEYYRLDVPYAMRVTWSGEFVHAAPWSEGDQGQVNVSHGCVGMSMADGRWLFERSSVGDIVQVVGSSRSLEPGNGYTDWNVSWSDWLAGSASGAYTAAPLS